MTSVGAYDFLHWKVFSIYSVEHLRTGKGENGTVTSQCVQSRASIHAGIKLIGVADLNSGLHKDKPSIRDGGRIAAYTRTIHQRSVVFGPGNSGKGRAIGEAGEDGSVARYCCAT